MRAKLRTLSIAVALVALGGCSTVQPLGSVARRASDPRALEQDVRVDTTSREASLIRKMAWAGFTATFECPKECPYSLEERERLAREISEKSFEAFDRELRHAMAGSEREVLDVDATVSQAAFKKELKTWSFRQSFSRWIDRMGLKRVPVVAASAHSLKALNPSEIGWTAGEGLAKLGKELGVDGMLVGHIQITAEKDEGERRLIVTGPKLWLFSTTSSTPVAVAGLKPSWRPMLRTDDVTTASAPAKLDAGRELQADRFDWRGIDAVATGFGTRVAHELAE